MIDSPTPRDTDAGSRRSFAAIYVHWFLTVWGAQEFRPWRFRAAFLAGLALIGGASALMGAVPTRLFGHDIFFLLDNGWRVINGQRPHLDYYSPWGPVTFLVTAAGIFFFGYCRKRVWCSDSVCAFLFCNV